MQSLTLIQLSGKDTLTCSTIQVWQEREAIRYMGKYFTEEKSSLLEMIKKHVVFITAQLLHYRWV